MNKKVFFSLLLLGWVAISFAQSSMASNSLKINKAKSSLSFTGKSTLHDWEITVNDFEGQAQFNADTQVPEITGGKLICQVKSFKSHKKAMDDIVFDAMNVKKYPQLTFEYVRTLSSGMKNGKIYVVGLGDLTIAGTKKSVQIELTGVFKDGAYQFTGEKKFKMSDFNVKPPSFMFGTVKSEDEIDVKYSLNFQII